MPKDSPSAHKGLMTKWPHHVRSHNGCTVRPVAADEINLMLTSRQVPFLICSTSFRTISNSPVNSSNREGRKRKRYLQWCRLSSTVKLKPGELKFASEACGVY